MSPAAARTAVVLPVKRLDDAKQRLSATLEPHQRRALMAAMLDDVLDALRRVTVAHELLTVTRDARAARAARAHGAQVVTDTGPAGHSPAALLGIGAALARGVERVLLIPGDCPLMTSGDLEALLGLPPLADGRVIVVPDREGAGTNALLLEPPGVVAPSFGPGSHARHVAAAQLARASVQTWRAASLELDVDTPDDLRVLAETLAERPEAAPRTAAVLAELPLAALAAG